MIATFFRACLLLAVLASVAHSDLPLPQWTDEELEKLRKGEIIPGAQLLVDREDNVTQDAAIIEEEEELPELPPEPEYDPKVIPSDSIAQYFEELPESYLVDPQRLLTMQETMDRNGFLNYHADASELDIRLYLFDAVQQIPPPHSLSGLVSQRYQNGPPTAVVFFFLGDPSRTMLAFGGKGTDKIDPLEVRNILSSAMVKSMEEPEPAEQVEAFIVQLSIKLFWLEKALKENQVAEAERTKTEEAASVAGKNRADASVSPPGGLFSRIKPHYFYLGIGASGVVIALSALTMGWCICLKNKKHRFPVIELPRRLGANYGAGVGAVIGFSDAFGSPAAQRESVPEY